METFNFQAITRSFLGDLYTPVGVYMRLRDIYPQSALMESSDYHATENSRSFIAIHPIARVAVAHGKVMCAYPDGTCGESSVDTSRKGQAKESVIHALEDFLSRFRVTGEGSEYCGLYGLTSFNAVRYFEDIPIKDEVRERDEVPDILYIFYETILVIDHFHNTLQVVSIGGERAIEEVMRHVNSGCAPAYGFRHVGETSSTLTDAQHMANVSRGVAHCLRGDVFQVVLSRRFVQRYEGDDFKLYRALRSVNPSPYLFYFDFGSYRLFGSSPETHNRVVGRKAYIDPIAGTAKRTGDTERDLQAAAFLRDDPKENAEHVMLVDLARNDLSRNCHDVRVEFYKDMQYYSHVIHLVSRVSGTLNEGISTIREFVDTFPAGTLSGAPKVRALQIISELEPHSRGVYGGCVGFIGLHGELNQAIVIRTFFSKGTELWFQAGSGVVAKSDERYELEECNSKLGALVKAIRLAETL